MTAADDAPAGRLGNLFRTTAFKLSLAYLAVFATFALLALGYVAWNASRVLDDQMVSTIEAEINGLSEQYKLGGLRRLIAAVERRAGEPGASLYLVTNAAGERIVGNIAALPTGLIVDPGQTEADYARSFPGRHRLSTTGRSCRSSCCPVVSGSSSGATWPSATACVR